MPAVGRYVGSSSCVVGTDLELPPAHGRQIILHAPQPQEAQPRGVSKKARQSHMSTYGL